jgi:hypothetical protein
MNSFTTLVLLGSSVMLAWACSGEASSTAPAPGVAPVEETMGDAGEPAADSAGDAKTSMPKPDSGSCVQTVFYRDSDDDGFGDPAKSMSTCTKPSGYVADKTDCNDSLATVKPTAREVCDQIDNNCDGTINGTVAEAAVCAAASGSYTGSYSILTEEKLGTAVVYSMLCTGTSVLSVDLSRTSVLTGSLNCSAPNVYEAGFSRTQSAQIDGRVFPNGSVEGTITHRFSDALGFGTRTFAFKGTLSGNRIVVSDTSNSWYPNPMSAFPWTLALTINASK